MKITKSELEEKIKLLGKISDEQKREIACSLIGHSKIITGCLGYVYCARCNAQIGDSLGGVYDATKNVIVGHGCGVCDENTKKLTWQDYFLIENILKEKATA